MPFITQNFLASTIKANGVTLSSSFDYSLLDIETNPTTFFPKTGKQEFGFTQQWGPEANQYEQADLGEDGSGLWKNGFDGPKNLDIENNNPAVVGISGGGKEGFTPQYTPQDGQGYIIPGEANKSDLVEVEPGGEVVDLGSLKVTALDIASDEAGVKQGASGGPNRIVNQSKKGFNSGQYTVTRAGGLGVGNIAGMKGQGGGVITQTLHTYTPQNPYFDAGGLDLTPIGSPQSVNQQPFTPKNNVVVSDKTTFYDATIK